jgi:hypothetical protein
MDAIFTILPQAFALGKEFLSEAGQKALSEQVIITGIVLFALRGHFKKIEAGLKSVAENVSGLGQALREVEASHSERIGKLETEVSEIKRKL